MYSWEIITINCHSEKSFFFFISCYCQMSVSISSQIYLFLCIRRSLPPEFCWSRHQFLSSCENWVSVGHSHCTHAPQSEGENRSQNTVINGDTCIIYWMIIILQAKPLQLFQERLLILSVNLVPNTIVHVLIKLIKWNFDIISKLIRHMIHSDFFELKAPLREICKKCRYFFN